MTKEQKMLINVGRFYLVLIMIAIGIWFVTSRARLIAPFCERIALLESVLEENEIPVP